MIYLVWFGVFVNCYIVDLLIVVGFGDVNGVGFGISVLS